MCFRLPVANHSDLPGAGSIFGSSQDSLMCVHISLSQDGFHSRGITPLLMSKELPNGEGFLDLRMRNMWSLIFYLGRAQPPLWIVLLLIFWNFCPQGMNSNCFPWGGWQGWGGCLSSGAAARRVDLCINTPKTFKLERP